MKSLWYLFIYNWLNIIVKNKNYMLEKNFRDMLSFWEYKVNKFVVFRKRLSLFNIKDAESLF